MARWLARLAQGGAVLLATENAPKGKRAWFGMFPQLGPSIGFLAAIPQICTIVLMIVWGLHSDRTRERRWHFVAEQQFGLPR